MPSRAEVSDIFNLLNSSVSGLVLAAEVAIGKNPVKSVALLRHLMSTYENYENDFLNSKKLQKPLKELIGEELLTGYDFLIIYFFFLERKYASSTGK